MTVLIIFLYMMSMVCGLCASYAAEFSFKATEEGHCEFGRDGDKLLSVKITEIVRHINRMTVSLELAYWVKVLEAYSKNDVSELVRLQNEERPKNNVEIQAKTVLFILSAIDTQEQNVSKPNTEEPTMSFLTPMANIKKSSFFKQITADK